MLAATLPRRQGSCCDGNCAMPDSRYRRDTCCSVLVPTSTSFPRMRESSDFAWFSLRRDGKTEQRRWIPACAGMTSRRCAGSGRTILRRVEHIEQHPPRPATIPPATRGGRSGAPRTGAAAAEGANARNRSGLIPPRAHTLERPAMAGAEGATRAAKRASKLSGKRTEGQAGDFSWRRP